MYIIHDIKSLLIRGLKRFYLSLENAKKIFHNNLYIILYDKKFKLYLFVKHFYHIKIINQFWIILFDIIK